MDGALALCTSELGAEGLALARVNSQLVRWPELELGAFGEVARAIIPGSGVSGETYGIPLAPPKLMESIDVSILTS